MDIKDGVQLRKLKQVGHLTAGVAQLQFAPGFSFRAFALRAWIPVPIVVLEYRRSTLGTNHLRHGPQGHDQFTQAAAVDVGNVFQV